MNNQSPIRYESFDVTGTSYQGRNRIPFYESTPMFESITNMPPTLDQSRPTTFWENVLIPVCPPPIHITHADSYKGSQFLACDKKTPPENHKVRNGVGQGGGVYQ